MFQGVNLHVINIHLSPKFAHNLFHLWARSQDLLQLFNTCWPESPWPGDQKINSFCQWIWVRPWWSHWEPYMRITGDNLPNSMWHHDLVGNLPSLGAKKQFVCWKVQPGGWPWTLKDFFYGANHDKKKKEHFHLWKQVPINRGHNYLYITYITIIPDDN